MTTRIPPTLQGTGNFPPNELLKNIAGKRPTQAADINIFTDRINLKRPNLGPPVLGGLFGQFNENTFNPNRTVVTPGLMSNITIFDTLMIVPLKNSYHKLFMQTDYMFINTASDVIEDEYIAVNVPVLNFYLEKAAIINNLKRNKDVFGDVSHLLSVKLENFLKQWVPLGVFDNDLDSPYRQQFGSIESVTKYERVITIAHTGRVRLPRLWKNMEVGDHVGFIVKKIKNPYDFFYDPKGLKKGTKTIRPSSFLQIIAVNLKKSRTPYSNSNSDNPNEPLFDDLCYWDEEIIERTGINDRQEIIKNRVYKEGHFIKIGVVVAVDGQEPTDQERLLAMRSTNKWVMLMGTAPTEIILRYF